MKSKKNNIKEKHPQNPINKSQTKKNTTLWPSLCTALQSKKKKTQSKSQK